MSKWSAKSLAEDVWSLIRTLPISTTEDEAVSALAARLQVDHDANRPQLHASASKGYKCADCTMDKEACPDCYACWWSEHHPNTRLIGSKYEHYAHISIRNASFQSRVGNWIQACFGPKIGADTVERNHRFIEEALELIQANGCTASEAHQLVDYVFNRPTGDRKQEIGGVMNTLAALCNATGDSMNEAAEAELERVWTMVEKIRAKQAAKPKHSPLPI
jgi:hypothetical protein